MIGKKTLSALLVVGVLASSVSTTAFAGGHRGGNGVAVAAGVLGAVVVGSLIANSMQSPSYYQPAPQVVYAPPPPVYYQPPQPVYYQAPPAYYQPQEVVYTRHYRERDRYGYRDGYYPR